ncbi:MAG TPA: YdjY domain-containing protein [Humisphaera sp.]|nr:YdjY domain-containing protein [Humisphaera sp.]
MDRVFFALLLMVTVVIRAQADGPTKADQPPAKIGHLPHVDFDVAKKQVRVECEALAVSAPLEFFCCVRGTNEHESVLRTEAMPSNIQTALLAIGLQPGAPITYNQAANKWIPPHGPPLHLSVEFDKDGKTISYPAYRWLRNQKTKQEPKAFTWVFAGSRVMPDNKFAADVTGYVVSICNFDLTMIDVPELVSSANETLEWERNAELMPKAGAKVWMVIEPSGAGAAGGAGAAPAKQQTDAPATLADPSADGARPALSNVKIDEQRVKELRAYWESKVSPNAAALKQAAEAHYEVIAAMRREQQRLVEEADRIQRAIDELEKQYQDMTTPHPHGAGQ